MWIKKKKLMERRKLLGLFLTHLFRHKPLEERVSFTKQNTKKWGGEFRVVPHEIGVATRRRQMDLTQSLLQKVKNRFMDPTRPASIQVRRVLHRSNAMEK